MAHVIYQYHTPIPITIYIEPQIFAPLEYSVKLTKIGGQIHKNFEIGVILQYKTENEVLLLSFNVKFSKIGKILTVIKS